jgi:hypothetical protein
MEGRLWATSNSARGARFSFNLPNEVESRRTSPQDDVHQLPQLPIPGATDANDTDPVGALGELIQMGDAPACNICGPLQADAHSS